MPIFCSDRIGAPKNTSRPKRRRRDNARHNDSARATPISPHQARRTRPAADGRQPNAPAIRTHRHHLQDRGHAKCETTVCYSRRPKFGSWRVSWATTKGAGPSGGSKGDDHQESAAALVEGRRNTRRWGYFGSLELDPPHRRDNRVKRVAVEPTTTS